MKLIGSALLVAMCVGSLAEGATIVKGRIFDQNSADTPRFLYENQRSEDGGKVTSKTRYTDPQGKTLVEEETVYEGGKLRNYRYNQLQTEERGTIEVRDGKVFYSFTTPKGTNTDDEKWDDNMLLPDMLEERIRSEWGMLVAGDDLKIRFLSLEMQDNFGFKIFRDKDATFQGKPALELVMKATGFFVAMAAPSFRITVEKEGSHRILKMEGRLPVRIAERQPVQSRKDLKAMDGTLVLDYVETPVSSTGGASSAGASPSSPAASSSAGKAGGAAGAKAGGTAGTASSKP